MGASWAAEFQYHLRLFDWKMLHFQFICIWSKRLCFTRKFFIQGGGQIVSQVVQEIQPVHSSRWKCIWPGHCGVWGLHISAGQSGKSVIRWSVINWQTALKPVVLLTNALHTFAHRRMKWIKSWKQICGWDMWVACLLHEPALVMLHYLYWAQWFYLLFRFGTTTNSDGCPSSSMGSNSYESHPIRSGGPT